MMKFEFEPMNKILIIVSLSEAMNNQCDIKEHEISRQKDPNLKFYLPIIPCVTFVASQIMFLINYDLRWSKQCRIEMVMLVSPINLYF